jgi:hypothetical protein
LVGVVLISTGLSRPSLLDASTVVFIPSFIPFLRSMNSVESLYGTVDDIASVLRSFRCGMDETAPSQRHASTFGNQQQACFNQHKSSQLFASFEISINVRKWLGGLRSHFRNTKHEAFRCQWLSSIISTFKSGIFFGK